MKRYSALILIAFLFAAEPTPAVQAASNERLDEVAQRGRHIMPFDLERTLHVFSKTPQGGVQQVIAKNPNDQAQIALIREHLASIAEKFNQRDFSSPAAIHGEEMPGLAVLRTAEPDSLNIKYRELENGAEITYSSDKPMVIDAIHHWFDAQLSDHARHASEHSPQHLQHHR